ncbi:MAG: hypothetical protein NTX72_05290 [Candidatus Uhrbacteria bacterium]|nr:hypothetical protein [Candidatus Uhrbacteria bacterium]
MPLVAGNRFLNADVVDLAVTIEVDVVDARTLVVDDRFERRGITHLVGTQKTDRGLQIKLLLTDARSCPRNSLTTTRHGGRRVDNTFLARGRAQEKGSQYGHRNALTELQHFPIPPWGNPFKKPALRR